MNLQILPSDLLVEEVYRSYWFSLISAGRAQMRFCTNDVSLWHVENLHENKYSGTYYVIDKDNPFVVGEFSLDHFTGKAAQVHFSTHPKFSFRESIKHGIYATDTVLNEWTRDDGSVYLYTLFGLTPIRNRAACLYNTRVGFKRVGILPKGIKDRGKLQDAVIFVKERKDGSE